MSKIVINEFSLIEDFSSGSGGICQLFFGQEDSDSRETDIIRVTSTNSRDDTQHDYRLHKSDWEFIKSAVDSYFENQNVR